MTSVRAEENVRWWSRNIPLFGGICTLTCKHHDVTLVSFKLKSSMRGKQALDKAQKLLLKARIGEIHKLKKLSLLRADANVYEHCSGVCIHGG